MHASPERRRLSAVASAAVAALLLLSACADNDASGSGSAATVGDARVSKGDLLGAVDRGMAGNATLNRKQVIAEHLTTQVRLALYEAEAAKQNPAVKLTDEQVKATRDELEKGLAAGGGLVQAAANAGVAEADLDDAIRRLTYEQVLAVGSIAAKPISDDEIIKAVAPDQLHSAHILVKERSLADSILAEIKSGGDFAALAAKHSLDPGSKVKGGDLGTVAKGTFVPEFTAAAYAAQPGEVVGPVQSQFGFHIIKVIAFVPSPKPEITAEMRAAVVPTIGTERLKAELRTGPTVSIDPRYGTWNSESLAVGPPAGEADEPSSPEASPDLPGIGAVRPVPSAAPSS